MKLKYELELDDAISQAIDQATHAAFIAGMKFLRDPASFILKSES